ncbi:MAG: putative bifunctional diguanylate cyclase/phosphodiesterase [Thiotrichales bacterium]
MDTVVATSTVVSGPEPVRDALHDILEVMLRRDRGSERCTALLNFQVDYYDKLFVTFGYADVKQLCQEIVRRLTDTFPKKDKVYYLGQGEFAMVLTGLAKTPEWPLSLAISKLQREFSRAFGVGEHKLRIAIRTGAAIARPGGEFSATDVLRQAAVALLKARERRQRSVVFDAALDSYQEPSLKIQNHLEAALDANELSTVFQPKTDIRTGALVGFEALSRWISPELGFVRPDVFVDVAERSGLIEKLTISNLQSVAKIYSQWPGKRVPIAVNLSSVLLSDPGFVEEIKRWLGAWSMPVEALMLEVTETALMDTPEQSIEMLNKLSAMGIKLAIDDFGTGYSSLAYLKMLPVQELKIDKSFVMNMAQSENDHKIVKSVTDLAYNLKLKVVAEGVEDQKTYLMLLGLGCDFAQGYLLGKPMKPDEAQRWQKENAWYRPPQASIEDNPNARVKRNVGR